MTSSPTSWYICSTARRVWLHTVNSSGQFHLSVCPVKFYLNLVPNTSKPLAWLANVSQLISHLYKSKTATSWRIKKDRWHTGRKGDFLPFVIRFHPDLVGILAGVGHGAVPQRRHHKLSRGQSDSPMPSFLLRLSSCVPRPKTLCF